MSQSYYSLYSLLKTKYPLIWVDTTEYKRAEDFVQTNIYAVHSELFGDDEPPDIDIKTDLQHLVEDARRINYTIVRAIALEAKWSPDFQDELLDFVLTNIENNKSETEYPHIIIFIAPYTKRNSGLDKYIMLTELERPTVTEIRSILETTIDNSPVEVDSSEITDDVVNACKGLTEHEIQVATTLSLTVNKGLSVEYMRKMKESLISKTPGLSLYHPVETDKFEYIIGLDNVKFFLQHAIQSIDISRGVLLLGVPGTGKTAIAKALAGEMSLPVVMFDFGAVFGSLVGESESRIRNALTVIDSLAPAILVLDEIEKSMSGLASSGDTDGGTTSRVIDYFLRWLQDRQSKVFVVATSNDITKLPPELTRAGRWDSIFFVDIPTAATARKIRDKWFNYYSIDTEWNVPRDWTGAEIQTVARLTKLLDAAPEEAEKYVVPIIKSRREEIEYLRQWAKNRAILAE